MMMAQTKDGSLIESIEGNEECQPLKSTDAAEG